MKVFIAGARAVKILDSVAIDRLTTICKNQLDIIVGDCYGVDSAVQRFCANLPYNKVTVFASNGKVRNNIGHWPVQSIPVESSLKGFEFHRQKDIAMAKDANFGFMIWDGKSKGTYQNIITLLDMKKPVAVYLSQSKTLFRLKPDDDPSVLLVKTKTVPSGSEQQLSFF